MVKFNDYFLGNKISDYGMENGKVDYRTLASSFNHVLNNNIMHELESAGFYFEQEHGFVDFDEESELDTTSEIFQFYIIDDNGASILKEYTNEIVFYNSCVDMYVWGVTHYGTAWDYVLTDIPCGDN